MRKGFFWASAAAAVCLGGVVGVYNHIENIAQRKASMQYLAQHLADVINPHAPEIERIIAVVEDVRTKNETSHVIEGFLNQARAIANNDVRIHADLPWNNQSYAATVLVHESRADSLSQIVTGQRCSVNDREGHLMKVDVLFDNPQELASPQPIKKERLVFRGCYASGAGLGRLMFGD